MDTNCLECGSIWTRLLHEGDEKNCDCIGDCLIICAEEGCL
jgi:hypothetical protein